MSWSAGKGSLQSMMPVLSSQPYEWGEYPKRSFDECGGSSGLLNQWQRINAIGWPIEITWGIVYLDTKPVTSN